MGTWKLTFDVWVLRLLVFVNRMEQAATINPDVIRVLRKECAALERELHVARVAAL